jgi:hypothetical protein
MDQAGLVHPGAGVPDDLGQQVAQRYVGRHRKLDT